MQEVKCINFMQTPIVHVPRWKTLVNSVRFLKDPIPLLNDNMRAYGETYRFYLGGVFPAIFTAAPAFIQHVLQKNHRNYGKSPAHFDKLAHFLGRGLISSDGEYWMRQRRLIQPGFHKARLEGLTGLMKEVVSERMRSMDDKLASGPLDMNREMLELAFHIIARSIFSADVRSEELERISSHITRLQEMVIRQIRQPFMEPWFRMSGLIRKHEEIAADLDRILLNYIRERRESGAVRDDLLQMLLDARYEDTGAGMTEQQLLDEVKILFVAGHETSANALSWIWYLLAQHPEVTQRLRMEIDEVLQGGDPEFRHLPRLSYTTAVIEEGMRLYPPAWVTDRIALADDSFEGIPIAKGDYIVTYIYGAHHHAGHWEDAEVFRPERFLGEARKAQAPFAYLPFGGGPRLCIGNNFAMMEMQLALAMMLPKYDFELLPGQQIFPVPLVTLRPNGPILMQVSPLRLPQK